MSAREILKTFNETNIPDLDVAVLGALELFAEEPLPEIDLSKYRHPLVVGSGNAEATGRIIEETKDALFASESTFERKLQNIPAIDGVILLSASGKKHAPVIAEKARGAGKRVTLLTTNPEAPARVFADDVYVFPRNREPYTYNTSTYMGMILAHTKENPAAISEFIRTVIDPAPMPNFANYDKYYLIVPSQFAGIIRMLNVKFIELFGRTVARDVETTDYVPHATTVVPSNELFISFGEENELWGEWGHRYSVPLPTDAQYGAMMAISYYLVGHIQKARPPLFKDNIVKYTEEVSKIFGQDIKPIVE